MLKGLRSLDTPEMFTRHCGFYSTCCRDALQSIFQRYCSDSGTIVAGMIERLLQEQLRYKRAYPIMHNDEIDSLCHLLQSSPDRFLTRCPPGDNTTDFPKSVTLYYCTLTRSTLLS